MQPETQRGFVCWAWVYVKCCGMAAILERAPNTFKKEYVSANEQVGIFVLIVMGGFERVCS